MQQEDPVDYLWTAQDVQAHSRMSVLDALTDATDGAWASGETLSEQLGISRAAVWKQIEALRAAGYAIEASPKKGYRVRAVPDRLYPWELARRFDGRLVRGIEYYRVIGSTNDRAKQRGAEGAPEGLLIVAETQNAGRGRRGRSWLSPPGQGIWASLLLRPTIDPFAMGTLTLLSAAAVAAAIEAQLGIAARIKWPNDVLVQGRKVCGILLEMAAELQQIGFVVVGIGINVRVAAEELASVSDWAASLDHFAGRAVDRVRLLAGIVDQLEYRYRHAGREGFAEVLEENRRRSATLGQRVRIDSPSGAWEGTAEDIAQDGSLVVRDEHGRARTIRSGEVSLRLSGRRSAPADAEAGGTRS